MPKAMTKSDEHAIVAQRVRVAHEFNTLSDLRTTAPAELAWAARNLRLEVQALERMLKPFYEQVA